MKAEWDWFSVFLYCFVAIFGMLCFYRAIKCKAKNNTKSMKLYYFLWFIVWVLFASFRYVTQGIGGTDAMRYIYFFENINSQLPAYYQHYDKGFWVLNKLVALLTSNHYVYFIIFYGINISCYIFFMNEFAEINNKYFAPYFLIFFIFLRGFTSFRTNISVAFLLVAIVFLKRNKYVKSLLFVFLSCVMHIASILYALVIIFCWVNNRKQISVKVSITLAVIAGSVGFVARNYIGLFFNSEFDAYSSYALRSVGASFFDNFWKIIFGQLILLILMVVFNKQIIAYINKHNEEECLKLNLIRTICIFDFITIPIAFILGIWRAPEYLYLPRLVMWGMLINLISNKYFTKDSRKIINIVSYILFITWFIFRLEATWQDSSLLPYVFTPFVNF